MAEVQDECAWRLGEWSDAAPVGTQQLASDGIDTGDAWPAFHHAVRSCLQALGVGQHDRWRTLLSSTRTVSSACYTCSSPVRILLYCGAVVLMLIEPVSC